MDRCNFCCSWLYVNCKIEMKRSLMILLLLIATQCTLMAQQSEVQIRQKINEVASSLKTLQCDFVQTKHLKMLNDDMVSKGKMYYQQNDLLRWEYISPYTYTFIINHDKVLLKNSKRNDVIDVKQNKLFKEIARIMMNSVIGNCLNEEKDFRSNISISKGEWVVFLLPQRKNIKQMFQRIVLHFSSKQPIVKQVELVEKNGDKTIIDLKNVRTNEAISTNMFTIR